MGCSCSRFQAAGPGRYDRPAARRARCRPPPHAPRRRSAPSRVRPARRPPAPLPSPAQEIYRQEEGAPGTYGIWGHSIGDLDLCGVQYEAERGFWTLQVDS
jgi:hypothetical protein